VTIELTGALAARLHHTRQLTEALAQPLSAEDQAVQSMPDTSPTKWHRAHTTWFFETFVLGPHVDGYQPFDSHYNFLFNSYYEAVGERYPRPQRGLVTRPGADQIGEYRRAVDAELADLVGGWSSLGDQAPLAALIELGIHHEQQHQELLLMDIKHVLSNNTFDTAYQERLHRPAPDPGPAAWVGFDGGTIEVGFRSAAGTGAPSSHSGNGSHPGFHFDNEVPRHQALVAPFQLADRLVTCGEWLAFMADGGYDDPRLWLSDGWYTRLAEGWTAPLYWSQDEPGEWSVHTLGGRRPVDITEPVCHVSFYEADAFATWAGARLPSEPEWEHAAEQVAARPQGPGALLASAGNDAGHVLDASPLHPLAAGPPGRGLRQLIGDCWEWTGSPYRPYPGYQVPEGAIGEYNGKFMINTMVLRGGCALTPCDHIRISYRNFFHPHTRWHLSGVRLARNGN
jgi:ergothioneine biosynthesis protein EgtB